MKKLLATALILCALSNPVSAIKTAEGCQHPFADIVGHWGENAICELFEAGVIVGYSEKSFNPSIEMSRAEFVKILIESLGYTVYAVQSAAFEDIKPEDWYYGVISFAHSKGFIEGYSDGTFHPNDSISRAEAVQLLINASGFTTADTSNLNHQFYDVTAEAWFAKALAIALQNKLVEGYGDGSFRPSNPVTRAEASQMLIKALHSVLK